jgi:hypothetical protein
MQLVARRVCAALIGVEKWRQSSVMSRPATRGHASQRCCFGSISVRWLEGYTNSGSPAALWRLRSLAPASTGGLPAGATGAVRA